MKKVHEVQIETAATEDASTGGAEPQTETQIASIGRVRGTQSVVQESARSWVLATLQANPSKEYRVADLATLAGGRYRAGNLSSSLGTLLTKGQIVKTLDGNRQAWFAVVVVE